jgi:hypothetical protein
MHATPDETSLNTEVRQCTAKKMNNRLLLYSCVEFNVHFSQPPASNPLQPW